MLTVGLDIGSVTTKIAVMSGHSILFTDVIPTGYDMEKAWRRLFKEALQRLQISESTLHGIVATGYGRNSVPITTKKITEIKCHAEGACFYLPQVRSVIDIGGQDIKFIRLDANGNVLDFIMNDKCAAGTGRFLEVMAQALEINLEEFGLLSLKAQKTIYISSTCTVFAESEIISHLSKGEKRENIVAGIHAAIANRIVSMFGRSKIKEPVVLTGGVALNNGIKGALERKLGIPIHVSDTAQVNGAIGAALLAQKI